MPTTTPADAEIVQPKRYATVLSRLLAAAIILTPLAAMLFPELIHRSGNNASKGKQAAPAVRSSVADPMLTPFSAARNDR